MGKEYNDGLEKKSEGKNKIIFLLLIIISVLLAVIVSIFVIISMKNKPMEKKNRDSQESSSSSIVHTSQITTADLFGTTSSSQVVTQKLCPICKSSVTKIDNNSGYIYCNDCGSRWRENANSYDIVTPNGQTTQITQEHNPDMGNGGNSGNAGSQISGQNGDPLAYSKAQLVDYYNSALKKSYSNKVNVSKIEQVDVSLSGVDVGNGMNADAMVRSIVENNTQKNGVVQSKSFVGGKSTDDGMPIKEFVLPTNLYEDAVKDISIMQQDGGYKMVITLKPEVCAYNDKAKYNASCVWPVDVFKIDFGMAVSVEECMLNYPGTVITAIIDPQGRVSAVKTEMPVSVTDAKASAIGTDINVDSISGKWTCQNKFVFV